MKREHKYKAWDKVKKKMFPVYQIQWDYREVMFFNDNTDFSLDNSANFSFDFATFDDCELLEWTGLKDKNGKDIYEGDLCRLGGLDHIYEVDMYKGAWGVRVKEERGKWHRPFCRDSWHKNLIVVGNIYENPELLQTV